MNSAYLRAWKWQVRARHDKQKSDQKDEEKRTITRLRQEQRDEIIKDKVSPPLRFVLMDEVPSAIRFDGRSAVSNLF